MKYQSVNAVNAVLIALLLSIIVSSCNTEKKTEVWPRVLPKNHQVKIYPRPAWLDTIPIIFTWNWDSAPIFQKRRGKILAFWDEEYRKMHTEEAVKKLKEKGITMVILHFFKGFGLKAESDQLKDFAKLNTWCKKYGIKVAVYIGSTICYETFLAEVLEAKDWFVPDYDGHQVRYGAQTFRKRVYFMHPGYRAYIKKVVRLAIEKYHVDFIHFDNTSLRGKRPIFFHPMAIEDFKTYLKINYTPEELKERLGFSVINYIEPPLYENPISEMHDPLYQLWTDFRCQQMSDFYEEMRDYIYELDPNVGVDNNPHSGMSGYNTMWDQGIDYARLLRNTDVIWNEEGDDGYVTDDGALKSRIRSYKMAEKLGNRVFSYTGQRSVLMGESLTFNGNFLGSMGHYSIGGNMLLGYELTKEAREGEKRNPYLWGAYNQTEEQIKTRHRYMQFFRKNFKHYKQTDNIADVAVLHNYESMTYNNDQAYESLYLFEEALIEDQITFDIIFDQHLDDLSKYKVLVLADQQCLSKEAMDKIRNFVKNGGGLVATGETSLYDTLYRRRMFFGLSDMLKVPTPIAQVIGNEKIEKNTKLTTTKNEFGKGRVVYIPEVEAVKKKPKGLPMTSDYWIRPENWKELTEGVRWASDNNLSLEVDAPQYVIAELTTAKDHSELQVHVLNYNVDNDPVGKNIEITVSVPADKNVSGVKVISPDDNRNIALEYRFQKGVVSFVLDEVKVYSLVVISLE